MGINSADNITSHFTWKEALRLPQWGRMASEEDGLNGEIQNNLIEVFETLEIMRGVWDRPVIIHCAYRPPAYNKQVGGAPKSAHIEGRAIDFHIDGIPCDRVKAYLVRNANHLRLRWESNSTTWVHIDTRSPYGPFTA